MVNCTVVTSARIYCSRLYRTAQQWAWKHYLSIARSTVGMQRERTEATKCNKEFACAFLFPSNRKRRCTNCSAHCSWNCCFILIACNYKFCSSQTFNYVFGAVKCSVCAFRCNIGDFWAVLNANLSHWYWERPIIKPLSDPAHHRVNNLQSNALICNLLDEIIQFSTQIVRSFSSISRCQSHSQ